MRSTDVTTRLPGAYNRALDDAHAPHPSLGSIAEPPFFALPIGTGMVGTKGGASTAIEGRVVDWENCPIPGLFAVGNTADSVIGPGMLSSGMTIGLALTWGHIAGTTAATNTLRDIG